MNATPNGRAPWDRRSAFLLSSGASSTKAALAKATTRRAEEGKALLAAAPKGAVILALDERGKSPSSEAFAAEIGKFRDGGAAGLTFVIGGPDGLHEAVRAAARSLIGFGAMTWPHQLIRVMLAEQIYRAFSILAGHPYHRE